MKLTHTRFLLAQILLFAGIAFATDNVQTEQDSLLKKLQAVDFSAPGVLITGEIRSGVNVSVLSTDSSENTGIGAASEADIKLQARPTKDTRVTVLFRVHQDWQRAHEEGLSPFLFDWLSYDGRAGNMDFNLGDMRVAYTPFTIFAPSLNLANEPEILSIRRRDAMNYKHLDDSNRRLLQGLNFSLNSGELLIFDNLYLQGTFSRLRPQSKKEDQTFFDFDNADRWLLAGRGGLELFGISLGVNYIYSFTRESGLENFVESAKTMLMNIPVCDPNSATPPPCEPFIAEDNNVISGTVGIDIARLAGLNGWKLGLGGEYALSSYKQSYVYREKEKVATYQTETIPVLIGEERGTIDIIKITYRDSMFIRTEELDQIDGSAILASLDLVTPNSITNLAMSFKWLKNDKDFISELAQSPVYYTPSRVLNSSAVDGLRIASGNFGTLENLYFANYTAEPLTGYNLAGGEELSDENRVNNNKKAHFLRSGYNNSVWTPAELSRIAPQEVDPGVNLALPFGLATPNRSGFLFNIDWAFMDGKIALNGFVNRVAQEEPDALYLDVGGGAEVEIGRFIGLKNRINLTGGFGKTTETDGFERSATRASAGLRVGLWRGLSLLGGFQMVNKDYGSLFSYDDGEGNIFPIAITGDELLWLAGPEIKITEGSYFNLQYGMLNYEYKSGKDKFVLDRSLLSADIRVKF